MATVAYDAATLLNEAVRTGKIKKQYPAEGHPWVLARTRASDEAEAVARALDYFSNPAARLGWHTPSLTEDTQYDMVRLSYDYWLLITLYRNHWISRRIVDIPARDMVKAWPRIISDMSPDDIKRVENAVRRTQVKTKLLKALQWSRLFGGAGALLVIDGHEKHLDEPLDLDDVEPGSFKGVIPFDRWVGVIPDGNVSTDFNSPLTFNLPEYYQVTAPQSGSAKRVHASRILRFEGPTVPTPEYEAQQYWGISVLEPAYEEIRKRDNMSWNILGLTFRAQILGIPNEQLAGMLSGLNMNQTQLQQFYSRMEAFNHMISNQSLVITGKDGGLQTTNYSFSGTADVYAQFQMDVAGAAEIPVTRLFGRTITGLGQGNDQDERMYEEMIAMYQDDHLRPQIELLFRVVCASELGENIEDIELQFPSMRVLDEKEKSDLAKTTGDNILGFFQAGLFKKSQALKETKQQSTITGFGTNITDDDIAEAEKEEKEAKELGIPMLPPPEAESEQEPEGEETETGEREEKNPPRKIKPREVVAAKDNAPITEFAGIPVEIEYSAGVRRRFANENGDIVYDRVMKFPYGFIKDTVGRDGDEIDVIIGPDETARFIYVIDMIDRGPDIDKRSDEDKCFAGFPSEKSAVEAFGTMYPADWNGGVTAIPVEQFRSDWL